MKSYLVRVYKTIEQDDFTNGCLPETFQYLGKVYEFRSSDLDLVRERLPFDLSDAEELDGRLHFSLLEDANGDELRPRQIEAWKRNTLGGGAFHASYTVHLSIVSEEETPASVLL